MRVSRRGRIPRLYQPRQGSLGMQLPLRVHSAKYRVLCPPSSCIRWRQKPPLGVIVHSCGRNTGLFSSLYEARDSCISIIMSLHLFHTPLNIASALGIDTFHLLEVRDVLISYARRLSNTTKTCHDCNKREEASIGKVDRLLRFFFSFIISLVPFLPVFPCSVSKR